MIRYRIWRVFGSPIMIGGYNDRTLQELGFMREEDGVWKVDESKMSYRDVESFGYERCDYREPQEEIHFTNNIESKMYRCGVRLYRKLPRITRGRNPFGFESVG